MVLIIPLVSRFTTKVWGSDSKLSGVSGVEVGCRSGSGSGLGGRGRGSVGLGGWGSGGFRVNERVLVFVVWAVMVSACRTESMRRVRVLYWWVETGGRDFGG